MGTRGRKSTAELSIIRAEPAFRPRPPADLPAPMAEEWKAIVNRMPNGWFGRESFGLLTAYLRHWWNAKLIAEHRQLLAGMVQVRRGTQSIRPVVEGS